MWPVALLPTCAFFAVSTARRTYTSDSEVSTYSQAYFCYSCMNKVFKNNWDQMKDIYYEPKNFTDDCLPLPLNGRIGHQPCSHSVCITMIEPKYLAGHRIGNNVIRGCYSGVFRRPADRRYLKVKEKGPGTSFCVTTTARELLPNEMIGIASNRSVQVCACYGNLCNEYPRATAVATRCNSLVLSCFFVLSLRVVASYLSFTV